ncbi:MAG: glycosyltransferase family 39 protein, partial [Candidatus Promineifilaceae bacterium]
MRYRLVLILISLLVFGLVLGAVNSNAGSDPKFTLLVSQSIVDNGTIRLDAYRDDMLFSEPTVKHIQNGTIIEHDGHLYNYFPTGPSIFTLPIVAALRQSGMDMRLIEDSFLIQKILAAFTCVLMLWIVYKISRCFLDEASSVVISAVSVLGTTIISSMGTALWTINFSTIFIALSLLLLARYETKKSDTAHPIFLGILFFLAFFSRPSAAAFIVAALAYLLVKERRQFLVAASVSFLLLILFTAWSRLEYGLWQPPYYSIARLQAERVSIWTGLIGNLISPSRGIFVFSPFFLLIIPGVLYVGRKLIRQPLMWMAVSWFVLSLILNARAVVWWGGDSFGPRLMTENVLALVLLVIIIWKAAGSRLERRTKWIAAVLFSVLGLAAIFINSYQGLYNPDTLGWNLFVEH